MYLPKHFQVDDLQILAQLITEYPLATLVGNLDGHLEVNHLPLMLSKDGKKFHGHIARTNPLVKVANKKIGRSPPSSMVRMPISPQLGIPAKKKLEK